MKDSEFCGNHTMVAPAAARKERVPCPVDPRHTVFKADVEKHVRVCNVTTDELKRLAVGSIELGCDGRGCVRPCARVCARVLQLPYIVPGINCGSAPPEDIAAIDAFWAGATPNLANALVRAFVHVGSPPCVCVCVCVCVYVTFVSMACVPTPFYTRRRAWTCHRTAPASCRWEGLRA